jgi:hypothetical protein
VEQGLDEHEHEHEHEGGGGAIKSFDSFFFDILIENLIHYEQTIAPKKLSAHDWLGFCRRRDRASCT